MCSPAGCMRRTLVSGHKAADGVLGGFLQGDVTLDLLWDLKTFSCPEPQFPHLDAR